MKEGGVKFTCGVHGMDSPLNPNPCLHLHGAVVHSPRGIPRHLALDAPRGVECVWGGGTYARLIGPITFVRTSDWSGPVERCAYKLNSWRIHVSRVKDGGGGGGGLYKCSGGGLVRGG